MFRLLCPYRVVDSLYDINFEELEAQGVRGIIFDLDNTIIPWDSFDMCPQIAEWLMMLQLRGFKVCIVSNNWRKRVREIADRFGFPFISRAYKPAKSGFRSALKAMGLEPHETAVVGDQLFTDVLGGNRLGLRTIWVKPLSSREFIGTRIHRRLEKLAVRLLRAKGLLK
ncbi:MAG TPA: YqeG family HAD IIIA-type phosphatase [Selenomonadales bacterium]|nr:YqeG family HAD IIIA-type phosphatase [Selenomonadales bacterium]